MKLRYLVLGISALGIGVILGLSILNFVQEPVAIKMADYHTATPPDEHTFDDVSQCERQDGIRGSIVNHHLLAAGVMERVFCQLATEEVIAVYLISPNHFWIGRGQLITSEYEWRTPYGVVSGDGDAVSQLVAHARVSVDPRPFAREHGISAVMPLVAKYLPNARVVPIIVKDTISENERRSLIEWLSSNIKEDDLVVASLDFSHYLTSDEADQADELSMAIVSQLDYTRVSELNPRGEPDHIDSKPGLDIILRVMRGLGATNFQLLDHTNSAKLVGDLTTPGVTSYITGYFHK